MDDYILKRFNGCNIIFLQHTDFILQNNSAKHTAFIKQTAAELGFNFCGIAKAKRLDEDARRLETWLSKGMQGSMQYMENHFELRVDPGKLVPGAKSVITLMLNYYPSTTQKNKDAKISKYAYGRDYHEVIREKLNALIQSMKENIGDINGRGFVDSAPVLERAWATKSGLGWIGKNGNLISKQNGSFFFIATLICDLELEYDTPFAKDYCGSCTRCIDECPTDAILPGKVIDGSKCISYFTIELKDALIDEQMKGKFDNWMFGCDTCQDVCPWNRFSKSTAEAGFAPIPEILNLSTKEWNEMSEEMFKEVFKHSPLKRTKYAGIKRNLKFILDQ
ncbi:MAG: tRNA epoxyqueuosine(34) reductase QueG [Chitinophagaceae bacterium]|jgi:epoxyqueuosine reductase|nr:tRNA epoxyqueuosine(34) reductase QueG [Chitinophagaceae bacterium]